MTNGQKLLLTYSNLYVCALYFDMNFVHIRDKNINYKMNDNKTCVKIPINWWNAEYKEESEERGMKTNTHIVIKREDIFKYLTDNQIKYLDAVLNTIADGRKKDGKKTDNSYYICNTDEPYADEVLNVILKAESEKASLYEGGELYEGEFENRQENDT